MSPNVDQGHDGWGSFKCAGTALKTSVVLCPHTTVTDVYLQIRGMVPTQGPFHQTASLLCVCVNLARKFTHFRPLGHRLAKCDPVCFLIYVLKVFISKLKKNYIIVVKSSY
jgi:hypothetical protein